MLSIEILVRLKSHFHHLSIVPEAIQGKWWDINNIPYNNIHKRTCFITLILFIKEEIISYKSSFLSLWSGLIGNRIGKYFPHDGIALRWSDNRACSIRCCPIEWHDNCSCWWLGFRISAKVKRSFSTASPGKNPRVIGLLELVMLKNSSQKTIRTNCLGRDNPHQTWTTQSISKLK